ESEAARHDTDDGVGLADPAEPKVSSDRTGVAAVEPLPESVAEDDLLVGTDLSVRVNERPAERGINLQDAKQRWRCSHTADLLRDAADRHVLEPQTEEGLLFERCDRFASIEIRR